MAPFGGVKNSGLGSVNGKEGLRSYAHAMPLIIGKNLQHFIHIMKKVSIK